MQLSTKNMYMEKSYPLSQAQLYIFNECMEEPRLSSYNIASKTILSDHIDKNRLKEALQVVIAGRPILRNRFFLDENGCPRQYEDKEMKVSVLHLQMAEEELDEYVEHQFMRPYSLLSGEPLCRFTIVDTELRSYLLCGMHHTITDGTSFCLLFHKYDLPAAYAGKPLRKEMMPFYEYTLEEEKLKGTEVYMETAKYYKEKFAGVKPTELSSATGSHLGNAVKCDVRMEKDGIEAWCKRTHVLQTTLLQAAFSLVLSRLSGQQKVVYVSGRHGRVHRQLFSSNGLYYTNIPVLIDADSELNVLDYLKQVAEEWQSTLKMEQYSTVQFCKETGCNPNIFYAYQGNTVERTWGLDGETLPVEQLVCGASADELECMIYIADNQLEIHMQASDAFFDEDYIRHFAQLLKKCVHDLMSHENGKLKDIEVKP